MDAKGDRGVHMPPSGLHVQTGCRSQGSQMQHISKHRTNRHCIPHADQAANVKYPRMPGCDAPCQCTHGKDKISGRVGGPVCSCKNEKQTAQCKGSNLQSRTTVKADNAVVPATDSLHQNFNTAYRGSNRLSVARQSNAAHKQA